MSKVDGVEASEGSSLFFLVLASAPLFSVIFPSDTLFSLGLPLHREAEQKGTVYSLQYETFEEEGLKLAS